MRWAAHSARLLTVTVVEASRRAHALGSSALSGRVSAMANVLGMQRTLCLGDVPYSLLVLGCILRRCLVMTQGPTKLWPPPHLEFMSFGSGVEQSGVLGWRWLAAEARITEDANCTALLDT